jgi:predicted Zn-dependent peptidase
MKKIILKNGLTVILDNKPSEVITSMLTVKCGSNYETDEENGISHLLEHSVFNGTKKRKALEIANAIEKLGGELNAATSNSQTFFYAKTLPKHITVSLDIISDFIFNPTFPIEEFEKEKKVVSQEISMIHDNYNFYQWVVFQQSLFKNAQKRPVYGSKEKVMNFSREMLLKYYHDFYQPKNMILTISGNIPKETLISVNKYFGKTSDSQVRKVVFQEEPKQVKTVTKVILPLNTSYLILGYKTPILGEKESYVFDIISAILGRGQSGKLFEEIRNKQGLAYSIGTEHYQGLNYNFFAAYANTQLRNVIKVRDSILKEFQKLLLLNETELKEAKTYLEGRFYIDNDDGISRGNLLTSWEMVKDANEVNRYIDRIKNISIDQVKEVIKKYLNDDYCMTTLEPKR